MGVIDVKIVKLGGKNWNLLENKRLCFFQITGKIGGECATGLVGAFGIPALTLSWPEEQVVFSQVRNNGVIRATTSQSNSCPFF
jgi:hypothetical protein